METTQVRRVVVAVSLDPATPGEFSGGCLAAVRQAAELARGEGKALHLVHVVEPPVGFPPEWLPTLLDDLAAAAREAMAKHEASLKADGIDVTGSIRTGEAWYEILAAAEQFDADVIVVASRRGSQGTVDHLLFGSTTLRLIRKSARAVFAVHPEHDGKIDRVVAAIDLGDVTPRVLSAAEALFAAFGARCWALHCISYPDDLKLARMTNAIALIKEHHNQQHAKAEVAIRERLGSNADHWAIKLGHASVGEELEQLIAHEKIDVVVMGSVSRSGIRGLITGNTAERVLKRLNSSVWVVKPAGWESPVKFS